VIFKPFGVASGGVVDPDELAQEFDEASRVANETSQYQWLRDAFGSVNRLKKSGHVTVDTSEQHVDLGATVTGRPKLFSADSPSAQLFQIPYNRGFVEVGEAGGTPASVGISWTSRYPELVVAIYCLQYIREDRGLFPDVELDIRAQFRIAVDDAPISGTGPFAVPLDGLSRGVGFGGRAFRSCAVAMLPLPAGRHYVTGYAAQASAIEHKERKLIERTRYLDDPPFEGVCIGSRRLILLRFKKGVMGMGG
jgi:hypothetical protein